MCDIFLTQACDTDLLLCINAYMAIHARLHITILASRDEHVSYTLLLFVQIRPIYRCRPLQMCLMFHSPDSRTNYKLSRAVLYPFI
jgi:hypothetical protein